MPNIPEDTITGDVNKTPKNTNTIQQQETLIAFEENDELINLQKNILEDPEAKKLLNLIDDIVLEMKNAWLKSDADIMTKTKQRFVMYVNKFLEHNIEGDFDLEPTFKNLRTFAWILPIAQKGWESWWFIYYNGQDNYFNQFKSEQLVDVLKNQKNNKQKTWEIINFLLSKEWEEILLKYFSDNMSFQKNQFSWVDVTGNNNKLTWVRLVIDNNILEKGKRIFFSFDKDFFEILKRLKK